MKTDLFYWLLNAGIYGTLIGLAVLLARKLKIPRRAVCVLWFLPFFRMWTPFGISSRYSVLNLLSDSMSKTVTVTPSGNPPASLLPLSATNCVRAAKEYFPITYKTNTLHDVFATAGIVWLIGFCTVASTALVIYIITMSELKSARHLRDNIYVSDRITSPALYGIFRPKIIIPEYMENKDLYCLTLHENAHARRNDNLFRCVALLTCALHWFNPFVWLFFKKYLEDLELACDESVIAKLNDESRKEYALSLLEVTEAKSAFVSSFGGAKIRVRLNNILTYRGLPVFAEAALTLFIAAVAFSLLTNATV